MSPNDPLTLRNTEREDPPNRNMRRLRDAPIDTLQRLTEEIGHRPATSLAEARAAALLDGRLRRAGLQVTADTFPVQVMSAWPGIVLGLVALVGAAAFYWLPLLTLAMGLAMVPAVALILLRPGTFAGKTRESQNVVGNRAAPDERRYRMVLLARLDTPRVPPMMTLVLGGPWIPPLRLLATLLFALFTTIGLFNPQRIWLYALILLTIYLLSTALADLLTLRSFGVPKPQTAAGLAVLLAASEQLDMLRHTELWAVGVGATYADAGLADLLRRYPFDQTTTLFVSLEGLGTHPPAIVAAEGWPTNMQTDQQLLDTLKQIIQAHGNVVPTISSRIPTLSAGLLHDGRRTLSIACLGPGATAGTVDSAHLEYATRLIIDLAQAIDKPATMHQ